MKMTLATLFLMLAAINNIPGGISLHGENNPGRLRLNIDFGVWKPEPSKKVGPAAVGKEGDFWNTVAVPWIDDHFEEGLKWADKEPNSIGVRMVNLAGGWGFSGKLGINDPMMGSFNYPKNNQGGNSNIVLSNVPSGLYDLYLYGHGTNPVYIGDYTLIVGDRTKGRKATSKEFDAVSSKEWVEGGHYVKFAGFAVEPGEKVEVLIQPGGLVSDGSRTFADAIICGLQLVRLE